MLYSALYVLGASRIELSGRFRKMLSQICRYCKIESQIHSLASRYFPNPSFKENLFSPSEFKSILSFRQQHNHPGAFGCSDIYVVCRLSPLTFDIRICPTELEDARWMKVADIASSKEGHTPLTMRMSKLIMCGLRDGFDRIDITIDELPSVYNSTYKLFHRPLSL